MNINNLKITCGEIIVNAKLTKESKLQLLNFVQVEADEHQLKVFLLDGEIITKADKEAKEIIDQRFEQSKFHSYFLAKAQ
jgi:hypothetical protein